MEQVIKYDADGIRAYRSARKYLHLKLTPEEWSKLCKLREESKTPFGNSIHAIIKALILGEPFVSMTDRKALTYLGYTHGLLKLAAATYQFKLPIDPVLHRVFKLMKALHGRETERENTFSSIRASGLCSRRVSLYLESDVFTLLEERADGQPLAGFVRQLIRQKSLTSRATPEDAEYIRLVGLTLRAAITQEDSRQRGEHEYSEDRFILLALNAYHTKLCEIIRGIK